MRIRLTPYGCDFLRVHWKINGDNHYFFPSCVMGGQFSVFLTAVYLLYEEKEITHAHYPRKIKNFKHEYPHERPDQKHLLTSSVFWDEEGFCHTITFERLCNDNNALFGMPDPVNVTIKSGCKVHNYTVDGKDLCYAVAKGCTEAIKKYGLTGYCESSGTQYPGDSFDIRELLFVKAYALDASETRKLGEIWSHPGGWARANASSVEQELALLLFDM